MTKLHISATIQNEEAVTALQVADALKTIADRVQGVHITIDQTDKPFLCPRCGESNWKACYYNAVTQGCTVVYDAEGQPVVTEYSGDENYNESTENESLWCRTCDFEYPLGIFQLLPVEAK